MAMLNNQMAISMFHTCNCLMPWISIFFPRPWGLLEWWNAYQAQGHQFSLALQAACRPSTCTSSRASRMVPGQHPSSQPHAPPNYRIRIPTIKFSKKWKQAKCSTTFFGALVSMTLLFPFVQASTRCSSCNVPRTSGRSWSASRLGSATSGHQEDLPR